MAVKNLETWVNEQADLVETFRQQGGYYEHNFPVVPNEVTNWIDEVRAIVETCALADLSHHMTAITLEGPDVIPLLKRLCVNDFDDFDVGQAKQIVMCNHRGHIMGDGPLLRLDEDTFYGPGMHATKWIQFNIETGEFDVSAEIEPPTPLLDGDPATFVYQVQGPHAYDVIGELTDADLHDIGFYRFEDITLAGFDIRAFGHGMSPEAGFEFHGPYEHAEEIRDAFVEAGAEHGLKRLGSRTYVSNSVRVGWVPPHPKPVYDGDEMRAYREWATGETERQFGKWGTSDEPLEATFSLEGSFDSDDVRDYYMTPVELGYSKLIDFDHEFIGKAALEEEVADPNRTLVSLRWDRRDIERVNNSLFGPGDNYKQLSNLPRVGFARQMYDSVLKNGELVGISHGRSYQWDVRGMVSLCRIDTELSDPGTEVELVWGEPNGTSPNPKIEDHGQTRIDATVQSAPYSPDKRGS